MAAAALVLSILSLLVAGAAALWTRSLALVERDRRRDEIDDRQARDKALKLAHLRLKFQRTDREPTSLVKVPHLWFVIINDGPADAVKITVDPQKENDKGPFTPGGGVIPDEPIELRSGTRCAFEVMTNLGWYPGSEYVVTWHDLAGHHQETMWARVQPPEAG